MVMKMTLEHFAVALNLSIVIAGLDPAIHLRAKGMDARVKPAHDKERAP
jgi:hypothetical protein